MKLIIANAHIKSGMSGSDNIYLHLADAWDAEVWESLNINFSPFFICYIYRIIRGCLQAIFCRRQYEFVYSASDFWMDSIPGFIMKLKGNKWIAGFYLFAPRDTFFYYWTQKAAYWLIMKYADHVFITSEPDRTRFPGKKITVVRGGVDMPMTESYIDVKDREYDAIFIGRLHPQKGLSELIDIWEMMCRIRPGVRLAIVGDGPLEGSIRRQIREKQLYDNIILFGYQDGDGLNSIIKNSKICLHPATYDSGGMAACQAMAYGLPVVGFDLPAYATYYPKGLLKSKDKNGFINIILKLLRDDFIYTVWSRNAREWASENSWQKMIERVNADIHTD